MLVDNALHHNQYFSPSPFTDLSDIFHTELFSSSAATNSASPSSASTSSRASSPSALLTPPQSTPPSSFPDIAPSSFFNFLDEDPTKHFESNHVSSSIPYDFMGAFGGDLFSMDTGMDLGIDMSMDPGAFSIDGLPDMSPNQPMSLGIDPQLVGTPSSVEEEEEPEALARARSKKPSPEPEKLTLTIAPVKAGGHGKARKGTVASGGVVKKTASAKAPSPSTAVKAVAASARDKENASAPPAAPQPPPSLMAYMPTNLYPSKSGTGANSFPSITEGSEKGAGEDDEDELPHDWRPSPEVFQKMTSKEKRQLRNKISARNFRVRRKEYISTLEGDIAERDRLLDAIRSELGSTQSENLALRQEIAALKRTLLDGRGVGEDMAVLTPASTAAFNLPPPAPLPAQSAAAVLAQQQQQMSPPLSPAPLPATVAQLFTPNPHKDISSASSGSTSFWGGARLGMGMGGMGGITPVHRVVMPEVNVGLGLGLGVFGGQAKSGNREEGKLQENLNPLLNAVANATPEKSGDSKSFDIFADVNPFTMKTLDAYRMHLWGKMAAQHHAHQNQQQSQLLQQQQQQQHQLLLLQQQNQYNITGLASNLRPAFFAPPPLSSLSALLSGKHSPSSSAYPSPPYTSSSLPPSSPPPPYHSTGYLSGAGGNSGKTGRSGYPSPPPSPVLGFKGGVAEKLERERERERDREKDRQQQQQMREQQQTAMYAALASQTLLKKLGSAFWDAFSGGSGSATGTSVTGVKAWDAEKVRKVLEGKAVVRIVDVEEPPAQVSRVPEPVANGSVAKPESRHCERGGRCKDAVVDLLEESMRSLSVGKKA